MIIVEPEYEIKIGIKDGKVISVDYGDIYKYEKELNDNFNGISVVSKVISYCKKAKKFLKK